MIDLFERPQIAIHGAVLVHLMKDEKKRQTRAERLAYERKWRKLNRAKVAEYSLLWMRNKRGAK